MTNTPKLISILGPTASGKTSLAIAYARTCSGQIISADSRQVYRGLDIGTGKELASYSEGGDAVPTHLIDVVPPEASFNVFAFQQQVLTSFEAIVQANGQPILCGGTGFYLSAILDRKRLLNVPEDPKFRAQVEKESTDTLIAKLSALRPLHNHTDTEDRPRLIRAIEIAEYEAKHEAERQQFPAFLPITIGLQWDPELLRHRIKKRLMARLDMGMIEEVETLRKQGLSDQRLDAFGLEYRFLLRYIKGSLSYDDMVDQLFLAICDFAKRQRTWFRRMERQGHTIHWVPGEWDMAKKLQVIQNLA